MSFLHRWGGGESKGSSHLTGAHVLLRCPLACPNSAPWCLICMMTFAPPSLCSFSSARFHNRGANDRGVLSITLTSSGKLFSSPAVFLHIIFFTFSRPVSRLSSLLLPISWYCYFVSQTSSRGHRDVRVQGEFSIPTLQPVTDFFLFRPERQMIGVCACACVCALLCLCTRAGVRGGRIIEKRENRKSRKWSRTYNMKYFRTKVFCFFYSNTTNTRFPPQKNGE